MSGKRKHQNPEARIQKSEWISVDDDLPDDLIEVLCCNANREWFWVGYHSGDNWYSVSPGEEIDRTRLVTHWMDLPEAPQ